jgi:hypothetical protein
VELTQEEKARITDSTHKIQSANASLAHVDPKKIPEIEEIQECLEDSDKALRRVLRSPEATPLKGESAKKKPS